MGPTRCATLSRRFRLLLTCALILLAVAARAATLNVGAGQTYTTIQSAINAAKDFDTVLVAPGTYTENIDLLGKWITVTSSGGAAVTVIDGSGKSAPAVTIEAGGTHTASMGAPVFSGFTVQNGGTGKATAPTGGIYVNLSNGMISNNVLTHNHCAGLWVVMLETPPSVQSNEVDSTTDNFDCPSGGGSGIVISRAATGCVNCVSIPVVLTSNTVQNNLQGGHEAQGGGGITVLAATPGAQIENNTVRNNASAGIGGGIFLGISDVEVVQNVIDDNQAVCGGAGIAVERTLYTAGTGTLLLGNNTLANNTLPGAACTVTQTGNASQLLFADEGSATYPAMVLNNILSGSSLQPSVACAFVNDAAAGERDTPVFDHNVFFNSSGLVLDTASCTDPQALLTDLNADPQLVNPSAFNFQLAATSPAVDAGNNNALLLDNESAYFTVNTATDFAGNARLEDATGKGYAIVDIGAYEVAGTADTQQASVTLSVANVSGEHFLLTALGGSSINLIADVASPLSGTMGCLGTVSFLEDGVSIGSAKILAYGDTATLNGVFLAPGTHHFEAAYGGQSPCSAGGSVPVIYIVYNYAPVVTLSSSSNPAVLGQPVTLTVTIASADPAQGGPIALTDSGTVLATLTPNAAGIAAFTTSALAVGAHAIQASYAGDSTHNAASASLTQTIVYGPPTATTLTITSSLNAAAALSAVTFTVHLALSGAGVPPVGSAVSLSLNNQAIVLATDANGNATYTTSALVAGTYPVTASFAATANLLASSAALTEVVTLNLTTTALRVSPSPAYVGQAVTLSATVSPSPYPLTPVTVLSSVAFMDGGTSLGMGIVNPAGQATLTTTALAAGTHSLTASYTAFGVSTIYAASTSPVVQEVILQSGFGIALVPAAVRVQAGQSTKVAIQLTSLGAFAGPLSLSVGPLPMYETASITPASVMLAAGGTGASVLTLNTQRLADGRVPPRPGSSPRWPVVLAATVLLVLPRCRKRSRLRGVVAVLGLMAALQTLSGCTNSYARVERVGPGTYTLTVTATDASQNMQSAALTVVVTQ